VRRSSDEDLDDAQTKRGGANSAAGETKARRVRYLRRRRFFLRVIVPGQRGAPLPDRVVFEFLDPLPGKKCFSFFFDAFRQVAFFRFYFFGESRHDLRA
jgi:hypothetical protein